MKVGIVCPYSWDVPGACSSTCATSPRCCIARGHEVSVLAPADDDTPLPPYVVPAGRAVPVPYNGSVARVNFGPLSAARVRRWLREGDFDVLHVHEPTTPSLSLLACWAATGAIVATFHTANLRSRAMLAAYPILEPALEKIGARIAVSEDARRTLVEHVGGDAVLIPNGVFVDRFAAAAPDPAWQGERRARSASSGASTSRARACRPCSRPWSAVVARAARGAAARRGARRRRGGARGRVRRRCATRSRSSAS